MGYSCYVHNGPMIIVPDMRVPGEDKFEVRLKCNVHGDKKSGDGAFCSMCGAPKVEYTTKTKIERTCYDEVDEFLHEFGSEDEFFDTYTNITTEFRGHRYVKHDHIYICEEECESIEVHSMCDTFGVYDSPVLDIHNTAKIRHLQNVLEKFEIPHEFKIGILIYRM